jgi:hypothetical protein
VQKLLAINSEDFLNPKGLAQVVKALVLEVCSFQHYKKLYLFQHIYFEGSLKMVVIAYNFVRHTREVKYTINLFRRSLVETCFSTVFPSTPFDSQDGRRNNLFRRFLILILRVLTLVKSRFFL